MEANKQTNPKKSDVLGVVRTAGLRFEYKVRCVRSCCSTVCSLSTELGSFCERVCGGLGEVYDGALVQTAFLGGLGLGLAIIDV